eukprot:1437545-Rhodomonas_salina.3
MPTEVTCPYYPPMPCPLSSYARYHPIVLCHVRYHPTRFTALGVGARTTVRRYHPVLRPVLTGAMLLPGGTVDKQVRAAIRLGVCCPACGTEDSYPAMRSSWTLSPTSKRSSKEGRCTEGGFGIEDPDSESRVRGPESKVWGSGSRDCGPLWLARVLEPEFKGNVCRIRCVEKLLEWVRTGGFWVQNQAMCAGE